MYGKYAILFLFMLLISCEKSQDKNDNFLKFYGDALEDIGYSVAKVEDGYIIAGQFTEITRIGNNFIDEEKSIKNMGIIKTGSDGNVIWKKTFGERLTAAGSKILALDDGSVICTGYVIDSMTLQKDIFVVKVNADGTGYIQKIYVNDGNQYGTDLIKTQEGFLILGTTDIERQPLTDKTGNAAGKKDIFLLRINSNLELIASPTAVGFPGDDFGAALKTDINGGYIVVGTTDRSEPGQSQNNIFLLRINTDCSTTQSRIIGGTDDEYAADIEVLSDGYLIAGTVGNELTNQQGYVWKISDNIYDSPIFTHKIEIEKSSNEKLYFSVNAICKYKTSSFIMAGQAGTGTLAKMLIFVTDADGNLEEGKMMIAGGTGIQVAFDVISDNEDNIIAVGKNSYENNSMISLLKFRF
jgi:hypothetical protein